MLCSRMGDTWQIGTTSIREDHKIASGLRFIHWCHASPNVQAKQNPKNDPTVRVYQHIEDQLTRAGSEADDILALTTTREAVARPEQEDRRAAGDDARSVIPPQNVNHPSDSPGSHSLSPQSSEDQGLRLILGEHNQKSHANHLPQHPGNRLTAFQNMRNRRPR